MPLSPEWLDREEGDGKEYLLRRHSQAVRQRTANPLSPGSNPGAASILSCFFRPSLRNSKSYPTTCRTPLFLWYVSLVRPGGGTGRRTGLKIPRLNKPWGFNSPPGHHENFHVCIMGELNPARGADRPGRKSATLRSAEEPSRAAGAGGEIAGGSGGSIL